MTKRPASPQIFAGADLTAFKKLITDLRVNGTGPTTGSVHFLGLGKVRTHFEPHWQTVAGKVHEMARRVIERRLTDKDVHTLYEDEGYIIVFSRLSKETGQVKCSLIAQEISRRLFGSNAPDRIDIMTIDVDEAGGFSSETVTVGQVSERLVAEKKSEASAVEIDVLARTDPSASELASTPLPSEDLGHGSHKVDAEGGIGLSHTEGTVRHLLKQFQFVYRPMWQVKNKVISSYFCIPARVSLDGAILYGGAAMPLGHASPENAALDSLTLQRVVDDLLRLIEDKRKVILVAPVHYFTINEPKSRRSYLSLCKDIPDNLRNLLVFELIGLPKDLPSSPLVGALSALKPFSRAVLVRRRFDTKDFSNFRGMGIYGTGVEVGNYPAPERQIIEEMNDFNATASNHRLSTYIHGLRSISLTSAAAGAGFDFIDGDPVMSVIDLPENISPFDIENLYGSALAPGG